MRVDNFYLKQADEAQCHDLGIRSEPYLIPFEEYLSSMQEVSSIVRELDESVDLHWHDFLELEYVARGNGVHYFNQKIIPFAEGSLHVLLPTDFHAIQIDPEDRPYVYSVKFSEMLLDSDIFGEVFQGNAGKQVFVPREMQATIEQEFKELDSEYQNQWLFSEKVVQHMLQRILIRLERIARERQNSAKEQQTFSTNIVVQTMSYIRENFSKRLTLNEIAAQVHLSPNYLSMLFRKSTGFTISEYLKKVRMRYAMVFLLNREKTVLQVSEEVGYNSYEHFERVFRKEFNVSPKEFRWHILQKQTGEH